jgi:hypothetical protein
LEAADSGEVDVLLTNQALDPRDIEIFFQLVLKIAKTFTGSLDVADIEKIKAVVGPVVPTNEIAVAMFFEKLMEQQKGSV